MSRINDLKLQDVENVRRQLEMDEMDREMEILLSDNGPAKLLMMHGGVLVECGGNLYVVNQKLMDACRVFPITPTKHGF